MYLADVVLWKHPTASFSWSGERYEGLEWLSPDIAKPTAADLERWADEFESAGGVASLRMQRVQARPEIRALAAAIHRRFQAAVPTDTMTAEQWERAIVDALAEALPQ